MVQGNRVDSQTSRALVQVQKHSSLIRDPNSQPYAQTDWLTHTATPRHQTVGRWDTMGGMETPETDTAFDWLLDEVGSRWCDQPNNDTEVCM
jgi:hypothetical protein